MVDQLLASSSRLQAIASLLARSIGFLVSGTTQSTWHWLLTIEFLSTSGTTWYSRQSTKYRNAQKVKIEEEATKHQNQRRGNNRRRGNNPEERGNNQRRGNNARVVQ